MAKPGDFQREVGFDGRWFVDALQYGTPPHGGLALGHDRLVASLLGEAAIQDVIAFPKTLAASDLMCGAPSAVDAAQVEELGLEVSAPAAEPRDEA